ncbi:hypothetical protein AiwAL_09610 [Acidiphilium sp. AL]|nr:hypothetical protein [Acidiphilium sp. AL]
MTVITMSRKELSRLQVLVGLADGLPRVDDATSRLMHLNFVASESAFAYFQAARA